jgi:hypothetical protein
VTRNFDDDSQHHSDRAQRKAAVQEAVDAKRKLEELFGGGKNSTSPVGNSPMASAKRTTSGRVFAAPRKSTGRQPSDYRLRLESLRNAREPEQIKAAADHFLERHQLPDEADILYRVLQHPSEQVVRDALGQLSALLMQGRLEGLMLLQNHLKELSQRVTEDATHSYIDGMNHQLASLTSP